MENLINDLKTVATNVEDKRVYIHIFFDDIKFASINKATNEYKEKSGGLWIDRNRMADFDNFQIKLREVIKKHNLPRVF